MVAAIFVISIPFFILASILSKGKGAALLAGYNTMPEQKKAQYDEVALCKFMGKILYGIGCSILLLALSELLHNQILDIIGVVLLLTLSGFALVYANTGNRFKKID